MRPDDGGSSRPPLPAEAGPNERTLYEVYDFQTGIVDLTASDWATSAESVRGLSADVRGIVSALRGAPDAWSGPAAEAAYQTPRQARRQPRRARRGDRPHRGRAHRCHDSATAARTAYVTKVRSVSLDVDPADYQHTPFTQPTQVSADLPTVLDQQAYDQAVAGARAAREQQAAAVLATFTDSMTTATKKLPVEPSDPASVPGGTGTSGGSGRPADRRWVDPVRVVAPAARRHGDPGPGDWTADRRHRRRRPAGRRRHRRTTPAPTPTPAVAGPTRGRPWRPAAPGARRPGRRHDLARRRRRHGRRAARLDRHPAGPPVRLGPAGAAAGMGGMLAGGGAAAVLGRAGMPGGAARAGRMPGSVVSTSSGGVAGRTGTAGCVGRRGPLVGARRWRAGRRGARWCRRSWVGCAHRPLRRAQAR